MDAENDRRQVTRRHQRELTDKAREIPLNEVLQVLGAERDPRDPRKWITAIGSISLRNQKFFVWNQAWGSGGAIDLIMALLSINFVEARNWLIEKFNLKPLPCIEQSGFILPTPNLNALKRVEQYLVEARGLPRQLIIRLMREKRILSDRRGNAVFVLLGKKRLPVGAELRSTGQTSWRGMSPGSQKKRGFFYAGNPSATSCILCESAIDAISCLTLHPEMLCVSTSGATPRPHCLPILITRGYKVYCGFDNDTTGNVVGEQMTRLYPVVRRLCPVRKDWNDELLSI